MSPLQNLNPSMYPNAIEGMTKEFGLSRMQAATGMVRRLLTKAWSFKRITDTPLPDVLPHRLCFWYVPEVAQLHASSR